MALAQENAQALAARALFDEARRLMNEGQFAAACPKLEESQRLRAGIGTQFNLAECYEKLGHHASAWSLYLRVAADTKALGQPEREQVARERAKALEGRVAYLVLQVPEPVAGLQLTLDGSALGPAVWGVATPIDPGEHSVVARAPGYTPWQEVAQIPERSARIELAVPRLSPAAPEQAAGAATGGSAPRAARPAPATEGAAQEPDRTLPYVIGGVGVGFVVLSGLFGLRFLHENGEAKKVCSDQPDACPRADIAHHEALLSSARGARKAGFVSLALGLAGVGVSGVWLMQSSPDRDGASEHVAVHAELGPDAALVGCSVPFRAF